MKEWHLLLAGWVIIGLIVLAHICMGLFYDLMMFGRRKKSKRVYPPSEQERKLVRKKR